MELNLQYEIENEGLLIEFNITETTVAYEVGPSEATARSHQAAGGSQTIAEFVSKPASWIREFPGLHSRVIAEMKKKNLT